jgi:hypothetical protein
MRAKNWRLALSTSAGDKRNLWGFDWRPLAESARARQRGIAIGEFPKLAADARNAITTEHSLYRAVRNAAKRIQAKSCQSAASIKAFSPNPLVPRQPEKVHRQQGKQSKEPRTQ